jgi:RNA polymerase sigma factor (sigma-70 family)
MYALWRALQYYRPEFGQKFTTSLTRFVNWECLREIKKHHGPTLPNESFLVPLYDNSLEDKHEVSPDIEHVREVLGYLDEDHRRILTQYYFEGMTVAKMGKANGYSKEAARKRLIIAREALREILVAKS